MIAVLEERSLETLRRLGEVKQLTAELEHREQLLAEDLLCLRRELAELREAADARA